MMVPGKFGTPYTFAPGQSFESIALADIDGDGALDIVGSGQSNGAIYFNDMHGSWPVQTAFGRSSIRGHDAALGDLDGDGDLELVAGESQTSIYIGDGLGGFTNGPLLGGGSFTQKLALGDLNHDGFLDIVIGSYYGALPAHIQLQSYINNQHGEFTSMPPFRTGN